MRARVVVLAVALPAALVVALSGGVASAHPAITPSSPLLAGRPARLTVAIFGDEGSVTGIAFTFPVSFSVTGVHLAQGDLGRLAVRGHTVLATGADIPYGTSAYLLVDGTPTRDGEFRVDALAHLKGLPDFHYPPVVVGAGEPTTGGSWLRKPWAAAPVAVVAAGLAAGLWWWRSRRRRVAG